MTDLQDELMGLEDEFNRLQESINKSRSKAARDSGLPENMRNSTEDQDYLEQGARPKNIGGIILYVLANYWNVIVLLTLRAERRQMHAGCTSGALVCCSITNYHHKEAKIFH
uniref:Uncharacterized protein n=1 Tax=Magallana gigas TaxID=29159 RepID=K1QFF8_MAGGI